MLYFQCGVQLHGSCSAWNGPKPVRHLQPSTVKPDGKARQAIGGKALPVDGKCGVRPHPWLSWRCLGGHSPLLVFAGLRGGVAARPTCAVHKQCSITRLRTATYRSQRHSDKWHACLSHAESAAACSHKQPLATVADRLDRLASLKITGPWPHYTPCCHPPNFSYRLNQVRYYCTLSPRVS